MKSEQKIYDIIIVGGGPAGYTAALYGERSGLKTLVLEKLAAGGQMALTTDIDNYPGFEEGIDGYTLGEKMKKGAERFGAESKFTEVFSGDLQGRIKKLETGEGTFYGKTIVLATGAVPRKLGIDGEEELLGLGIHYCAACDGMFYRNKTVVVVGGGNTAAEDALLLSRVAKKVYLIHRRDSLRASKVYEKPLLEAPNVEIIWDSSVVEFLREERLTGIKVVNKKTGESSKIMCDGVFVSVGRTPETELWKNQVETDSNGYIVADETTRTNVPGVFAAGDIRTKALRQVVTAAADGASAAYFAEEYLLTLKDENES